MGISRKRRLLDVFGEPATIIGQHIEVVGKLKGDGHFLICESCRALAELDAPSITQAINKSAESSGFESRRHTVEILGLCPECRQ